MVHTIITHRDIGDNLLENGLSLYKFLVLATLCFLELRLELLNLASCEKLCIVSRGSHREYACRGGEPTEFLSWSLPQRRVTLLRGHGDDNVDDEFTTTMSSDAIGTYARSARVWFPDKEQGWISAEVTQAGKGANNKVKLQFIDERGKVHGFNVRSNWKIFHSWSVALMNGWADARPALL